MKRLANKYCLRYKLLRNPDKDTRLEEGGRTRLENRNADLKKPWTVGLGATPEMNVIGFQTEMKTKRVLMTIGLHQFVFPKAVSVEIE